MVLGQRSSLFETSSSIIFQAKAHALNGQLIFAGFLPCESIDVLVRATGENMDKAILLQLQNKLTPTSAFHFIHLLSHLNGAAICDVRIDGRRDEYALNPAIMDPSTLEKII